MWVRGEVKLRHTDGDHDRSRTRLASQLLSCGYRRLRRRAAGAPPNRSAPCHNHYRFPLHLHCASMIDEARLRNSPLASDRALNASVAKDWPPEFACLSGWVDSDIFLSI